MVKANKIHTAIALVVAMAIGLGLTYVGILRAEIRNPTASTGASLSSANTFTALQQFSAGASTTMLSVFNNAWFGATATSSFNSAGALTLITPLTVGNGGTGATAFSAYPLVGGSGTGALTASSSPTAVSFQATSTTLWSTFQLLVATAASTTNATVASFFQLPNSATQAPTQAGALGFDTTSNQFKVGNGTASVVYGNGNIYPSFTYSTSTTFTGTTTRPIGTAYVGETWAGWQCFTDTGTLDLVITDGTNRMNFIKASTTVGTNTISTNNTFTAGEKRYVEIGNPASSPTAVSCTISKTLTAD